MSSLHALILAAGEGKRMRSQRSKLLHSCAGIPVVEHVVRAVCALEPASVHVVVADGDAEIRAALEAYPVSFAVQDTPRGTADAVTAGLDALGENSGRLLVINGDCPGLRTTTLAGLVGASASVSAAVLSVRSSRPGGAGRVVRDDDGSLLRVVEETDVHPERGAGSATSDAAADAATEVNAGAYCFDLSGLDEILAKVDSANAQAERYLTQVFALLSQGGASITAMVHDDADEVQGVNSRADLAFVDALLRRRKLEELMEGGVTVRDPSGTWVDIDVHVGMDTILFPGVTLEGSTRIGEGCTLRSHVRVTDSRIGDRVNVLDGSIIEESVVDDGANLGPYARLRPGSDIGARAKVGNFVETKATRLGVGSKASHLSYLGNARIGDNVNIGAGTITCNYDGANKFETVIDDGAFIGSNSALVAPVRVGKNAYVGAGSTITEDVPDRALGLARGRQVNKEGWAEKD